MKMEKIDLALFFTKQVTDASDDELLETTFTEIEPGNFKIEYDSNNYLVGFLFYVKITETEIGYEFCVYRTAYGDLGISIYDKNLNFIEMRDYVA